MTTAPQGPRFRAEDLEDPERAGEALARWDELESGFLDVLARHPRHGPRLATLRRAEQWLRSRPGGPPTVPAVAPGSCPTAEDLYDFGRGPGYAPIGPARRSRIEAHVGACADCREIVATLATPPPLPLDFDLAEGALHAPAGGNGRPEPHVLTVLPRAAATQAHPRDARALPIERPARVAQRPRGLRRLVPFLAAAGLFLAAGVWITRWAEESRGGGPAPGPLLRGRSAEILLWPRGSVLAAGSALSELGPALADRTVFELVRVPEATTYRVELRATGAEGPAAGAFATGTLVATVVGPEPELVHAAGLAPGRYTWTAWATVHGLETALGARDFVAVADPALEERLAVLAAVDPRDDPTGRVERVLELLDELGYRADARALARTLPESPLRERWLAPVPGR